MGFIRSGLLCLVAATLVTVSLADVASAQRFTPKNRGLPGRREGGGTRGACPTLQADQRKLQDSVVAIVPQDNVITTTSDHPTLMWHVPQTSATSASFVLLNEQGDELYSQDFALSGKAGIVRLSIPKTAQSLRVGQTYQWKFALVCDADDRSGDLVTEGWIERVNLPEDVQRKLQILPVKEHSNLYAESGVWQEAVNILADLREQNPNPAVQNDWKSLLQSVDLGDLAQEPVMK
ncbi:DUF928 domain-containing protein [Alkalinema sp. FACHB-956]|uniref:DUF928 domain-containing protein n=1 Tax=Alkalinema sp. FACHB-956 TaxID=2692768 RepID=UPI0016824078|nr:DUF928 domain-containing protein [Alkalinema sp. FACHB-956]MBD2326184.1 DUF928 domain-containing protein [Alkalinema sp. FACHB-956]